MSRCCKQKHAEKVWHIEADHYVAKEISRDELDWFETYYTSEKVAKKYADKFNKEAENE